MFKPAAVTLAVLCTACGGGSDPMFAPVQAPAQAPVQAPVQPVQVEVAAAVAKLAASPIPVNPNCVAEGNHVACELWSGDSIGVGIPPNSYATFTNKSGAYLQIDQALAFTGEQGFWSEFCVYKNVFLTGQTTAGNGEVGCASKQIGEDYRPITWGPGTGLSVEPGGVIYVASHTQPSPINHTYSLRVRPQTTGLYSWRQPAMDQVIPCNGTTQSTNWTPWVNHTSDSARITGVAIYAESGNTTAPNALVGAACIYIHRADGSQKYANCDPALRTRGDLTFNPPLLVDPGESVAAQAINSCTQPALWGWAAFLRAF